MAKKDPPQLTKRDWFLGVVGILWICASIAVIVSEMRATPAPVPSIPTPRLELVAAATATKQRLIQTENRLDRMEALATERVEKPTSTPSPNPTRVMPIRKPQPARVPATNPQSGWEVEERCIEQFMVVNQRGRYARGMMSDDAYLRAVGRVMEWGLTRTQCGLIWDGLR